VPAGGAGAGRRGRGVLLDRLRIARATRRDQQEGDGGPAAEGRSEYHALRWQAHDLRRLQDAGRDVAEARLQGRDDGRGETGRDGPTLTVVLSGRRSAPSSGATP